ncbi:MAG: DUF937 domain-containing protein [Sphingopyxis sp.]|jgi:hypothetical protein|nr:DUF937 domain-containing protein [Sphingopyxis sp.]
MDIAAMLAQSGALDSTARELGISPQVAAAGAAVLLPAIMGGFKNQAQTAPGGADGLGAILGSLGGGGLLDAVVGAQPTPVEQGNDVLGQIFGSRDVSRQVAAHASEQSGISSDVLKRLLPVVAMLVAGYLARQHGGAASAPASAPAAANDSPLGGMLGQVLGSVLGGGGAASAPAAPAPAPRAGGLAGMLDMDGDGNPLNDIIGMAGRLAR